MHKYDFDVDDIISLSKQRVKEHCYNKWLSDVIEESPFMNKLLKIWWGWEKIDVQDCFQMRTADSSLISAASFK